jgi:hypothetical protein
MGTLTTKLGLFKPADTDNVSNETDLNDNYDVIDAAMGELPCTSTTRPTGSLLWAGRQIYETDTLRSYVYTGSAWVPILGQGCVRRLVEDETSAVSSNIGATETIVWTLNYNTRAAYRYTTTWICKLSQSVANERFYARLRKNTVGGTLYYETAVQNPVASQGFTVTIGKVWPGAATEAVSLNLTIERQTGGGTMALDAKSSAWVDEIS